MNNITIHLGNVNQSQIKYHLTPSRMAVFKKKKKLRLKKIKWKKQNCYQGYRKPKDLYIASGL